MYKTTVRFHLTLVRMAETRKQRIKDVGEGMGKGEILIQS